MLTMLVYANFVQYNFVYPSESNININDRTTQMNIPNVAVRCSCSIETDSMQ